MEKKLLLAKNIMRQAEILDTIKILESKLSEDKEASEAEGWKTELQDLSEELAGIELTEVKICSELNGPKSNGPKFPPSTNGIFSRPEENNTFVQKPEHPNSEENFLHPRRPISHNFIISIPKPDRFQKGQNFSRFVRRFVQYITLSKLEGEN